jgi:hypothetical protein
MMERHGQAREMIRRLAVVPVAAAVMLSSVNVQAAGAGETAPGRQ